MKLATTFSALALSLAILSGAAASAQAGPAPEAAQSQSLRAHRHHSPEHETRKLTHELNLSPEQAARIEPILASRRQQMHALRESGSNDRAQRHGIARSTRRQIDSVLSEQQRQQLHAIRAARHQDRQRQSPAPAL